MSDNIVTSASLNADSTKKQKKTSAPKIKRESVNEVTTVAVAPEGYKFVFFDSGSSYTTPSGKRFTSDKRIQLLPVDEADHLLTFSNFRIPDQLELAEYKDEV